MEDKKKMLSVSEKIRPLEKDEMGRLLGGFTDIGVNSLSERDVKNKANACSNHNCNNDKNKGGQCVNTNCSECSCSVPIEPHPVEPAM